MSGMDSTVVDISKSLESFSRSDRCGSDYWDGSVFNVSECR